MKALRLRDLLGLLVGDVVGAETFAAKATIDFIRDVGFTGGSGADLGEVNFVRFSYRQVDHTGDHKRTIRVPLLSLLPIPLQQIEQTELEFFAKVNDVGGPSRSRKSTPLDLMCEVAPHEPEGHKAPAPRIKVRLTLKQSDLPTGVAATLRLVSNTIGDTK